MRCLFLILCAITFAHNTTNLSLASESIVKIAIADWKPHVDISQPGYGFVPELILMSFIYQDIRPEFVIFENWEQAYSAVLDNTVDCSAPFLKSSIRKEEVLFSKKELIHLNTSLFVISKNKIAKEINANNFSFQDLFELNINYQIIRFSGYHYHSNFEKINNESLHDSIVTYYKLLLNKVDGILDNELVGWNIINNFFPQSKNYFQSYKITDSPTESYLICSKNKKEILDAFDKGFEKTIMQGLRKELIKKYKPSLFY